MMISNFNIESMSQRRKVERPGATQRVFYGIAKVLQPYLRDVSIFDLARDMKRDYCHAGLNSETIPVLMST